MTNLEKAKASNLPYSPQAQLLIEHFAGDFPFAEFEEWFIKNKFIVGGGMIVEFLELRRNTVQNSIKQITNLPNV